MPIIGLSLIIQIALAIHVIKTGKDTYWIYILLMPGIGPALYFFTQVLPDLGQSRTAHTAKNSLMKAIDPQRELRKKKAQLELANTLANKQKLAEECLEAGMHKEAIELFKSCLTGVGECDPDIMLFLAQSYFASEDYQLAIQILDDIIKTNPNFNSTDGHLLYARSLEKLEKSQQALEEYAIVSENYPGEEGRVRYGLLLVKMNQAEKASEIFNQAINRSKLAPKFYQRKEKYWIKLAKTSLKQL